MQIKSALQTENSQTSCLKGECLRKHPAIFRFGTMGSPIPAKFFFMIFYVFCSNFYFRRKSLK
jgi:hypothetical protein